MLLLECQAFFDGDTEPHFMAITSHSTPKPWTTLCGKRLALYRDEVSQR